MKQCWDYSFYTSSGWPKFTYITKPVPPETRCVTYKCPPKEAHASIFFFTSGTPHARHIHAHFELWGRPFPSSLLASFCLSSCWCCYERNSIHTASLSHFIFLIRPVHHLFFYLAGGSCWIHVNVSCSACIYSTLLVSLNDKPHLAHRRQQSVGSAFQFHYFSAYSSSNNRGFLMTMHSFGPADLSWFFSVESKTGCCQK